MNATTQSLSQQPQNAIASSLDSVPPAQPSLVSDQDWQGNTEADNAANQPPRCDNPWALHLGQSSTAIFLRDVQSSVCGSTVSAQRNVSLYKTGATPAPPSLPTSDYLLPSRSVGEGLLRLYVENCSFLYPVVDMKKFDVEYRSLYEDRESSSDQRTTQCIANLMFALAEQSRKDTISSLAYFHRAKRLLDFDIFSSFSLEAVQALVLCTQYMQSTEVPRQCWTMIGIGIRAAQTIGLHLPAVVDSLSVDAEREQARIVWNCLITLDRTVSMTLGRRQTVEGPMYPIEPGPDRSQPFPTPRWLFKHSCGLFDIQSRILSSLFSDNMHKTPVYDKIMSIIKLEAELQQWSQSVPEIFQLLLDTNSSFHRHSLKQRYLQIRLILLRPAILVQLSEPTADLSDLIKTLVVELSAACFYAAQDMAELAWIQACGDTKNGSIPWWYNVQFAYNAGVTILAARNSVELVDRIGLKAIEHGMKRSIETLTMYVPTCTTAGRCLSALATVARNCGLALSLSESIWPSLPDLELRWTLPPEDLEDVGWMSLAGLSEDAFALDQIWQ